MAVRKRGEELPQYDSIEPLEPKDVLEHLGRLDAATEHAEKKHAAAKKHATEAKDEVDTFKAKIRDILKCRSANKPLWALADGGITAQPPKSWLPGMADGDGGNGKKGKGPKGPPESPKDDSKK